MDISDPSPLGPILPLVGSRKGNAELDLTRLTALQKHLGSDRAEIIGTLVSELSTAVEQIEAALKGGDLAAAAPAAHAARNSALMLDARPLLAALRQIEAGARRDDPAVAQSGLEGLHRTWPALHRRLMDESRQPESPG